MKAVLHGDGGSRGNPGPAASGAVLFDEDGEVLAEVHRYLGTQTNNYAEYTAIIIGLEIAEAHGVTDLIVRLDSELAVKQLKGEYRVKNEALARLYLQVVNLSHSFKKIEFQHVRREHNKHADALVNKALDEAAR
ncbi:ribonuclease HI family protein [Candidatus Uhrbacteria bacterium]|nr:ribonuclease HI family protein [Candidatus Uhrbacteria bacterium]